MLASGWESKQLEQVGNPLNSCIDSRLLPPEAWAKERARPGRPAPHFDYFFLCHICTEAALLRFGELFGGHVSHSHSPACPPGFNSKKQLETHLLAQHCQRSEEMRVENGGEGGERGNEGEREVGGDGGIGGDGDGGDGGGGGDWEQAGTNPRLSIRNQTRLLQQVQQMRGQVAATQECSVAGSGDGVHDVRPRDVFRTRGTRWWTVQWERPDGSPLTGNESSQLTQKQLRLLGRTWPELVEVAVTNRVGDGVGDEASRKRPHQRVDEDATALAGGHRLAGKVPRLTTDASAAQGPAVGVTLAPFRSPSFDINVLPLDSELQKASSAARQALKSFEQVCSDTLKLVGSASQ